MIFLGYKNMTFFISISHKSEIFLHLTWNLIINFESLIAVGFQIHLICKLFLPSLFGGQAPVKGRFVLLRELYCVFQQWLEESKLILIRFHNWIHRRLDQRLQVLFENLTLWLIETLQILILTEIERFGVLREHSWDSLLLIQLQIRNYTLFVELEREGVNFHFISCLEWVASKWVLGDALIFLDGLLSRFLICRTWDHSLKIEVVLLSKVRCLL